LARQQKESIDWDAIAARRWQEIKKNGTPFTDSKGEGLIYRGKKRYTHMVAGAEPKEIPPWPADKLPWEE
jgi:hypothetical protein